MSDIDSTAATQAPSFSQIRYAELNFPHFIMADLDNFYSSQPSPVPSQDFPTSNARSPSPAGRSPKRRRLNSSFPENHYNSNHYDHDVDLNCHPAPFLPSHSATDLHSLFHGTQPFEPHPRSFLGHDREFMSHILSSRGVVHRAGAITRHIHIPGLRFGVEYVPVISADNTNFVGWRREAKTWPMDNGRYLQQSFTFPHYLTQQADVRIDLGFSSAAVSLQTPPGQARPLLQQERVPNAGGKVKNLSRFEVEAAKSAFYKFQEGQNQMDNLRNLVYHSLTKKSGWNDLDFEIVGWSPQFELGERLDFDTMIALTGSLNLSYVNTISAYVAETWPHLGPYILPCFRKAVEKRSCFGEYFS